MYTDSLLYFNIEKFVWKKTFWGSLSFYLYRRGGNKDWITATSLLFCVEIYAFYAHI
jgi:hypothetical protein